MNYNLRVGQQYEVSSSPYSLQNLFCGPCCVATCEADCSIMTPDSDGEPFNVSLNRPTLKLTESRVVSSVAPIYRESRTFDITG